MQQERYGAQTVILRNQRVIGGRFALESIEDGDMAIMDDLNRNRPFQNDADFGRDEADAGTKRRRDKEAAKAAHKEKLDDKLDKALEESFPGSDPISITQPPQSAYDKPKH